MRRTAPINGLDYETAGRAMERLDDAVEALTGDREALWGKSHGGSVPIPDAVLKPVEPLVGGVLESSPALLPQLGDFVIEQIPASERAPGLGSARYRRTLT